MSVFEIGTRRFSLGILSGMNSGLAHSLQQKLKNHNQDKVYLNLPTVSKNEQILNCITV